MIYNSVIQVAREIESAPFLSRERLLDNKNKGLLTSLLFDTNIMICISNYMQFSEGKIDYQLLETFNLIELIDICNFCQKNDIPISISPGFCMPEIAPGMIELVIKNYNDFFILFDIILFDDIHGGSVSPIIEMHNIMALPKEEIKVRVLPYIYICALIIVDCDEKIIHPWAKFEKFLDLIIEYCEIFSEKELTIAKIVLGDFLTYHKDFFDANGIELIHKIINNFSRVQKKKKKFRRPSTAEEVIRTAFNASSDINLINMAVTLQNKNIDGLINDVWLVSNDAKLTEFLANIFGYSLIIPNENGMFAQISYPQGFQMDMMPYDAKSFAKKIYSEKSRSVARIDSDLWVERVKKMNDLVKMIFTAEKYA